jgi:hypothetical protein
MKQLIVAGVVGVIVCVAVLWVFLIRDRNPPEEPGRDLWELRIKGDTHDVYGNR